MKLVFGLGNPGSRYVATRHNVGFEVVDALAARLGLAPRGEFDRLARVRFEALTLDGQVHTPTTPTTSTTFTPSTGPQKLLLGKPTTYMNLSGQSIQQALRFYKLEPADLLVVVDEIMLPAGRIRLRAGGSDAGHNGLRDITRALGTDRFPRLRIGVDPPPPGLAGRDYVLGRFTDEQRQAVDAALPRAVECVLAWIGLGIEKAMSRFNADPAPPPPPEEAQEASTEGRPGQAEPAARPHNPADHPQQARNDSPDRPGD